MDMEQIILDFWACSLRSDFSEFDWDEAFYGCDYWLARNCTGHGHCSLEEFRQEYEDIFGDLSLELPDWALYDNNIWGYLNPNAMINAMLKIKQEFLQDLFSSEHADNYQLLLKVRNRHGMSESELISLFDECIHAQHYNGNIMEDVNIDDLRKQAENEWKEEQEEKRRFPTNIREFLQVG